MKKTIKRIGKILAWGLVLLCGIVTAGILWPLDHVRPAPPVAAMTIRNVNIVDVESGQIIKGQTIRVDNGIITEIAPDIAEETEEAGAFEIDGSGQFAIPGMFDMHAHAFKMAPELTHPLFVAAGVTAVRDMGGCIGLADAWVACADDKRAWNQMVQDGTMVGPRFDQITSLAMNGGSEMPDELDRALGGATPEGARARVAYDKARGIDFLKTYSLLPRESYFALAEEVAKEGLSIAGHLPFGVTAPEAVAAGQRSFEHAFVFIWDCYPGMAALRESGDIFAAFTNEARSRMIADHDEAACQSLRTEMAAAGTAFVPTHTTRKLDAYSRDADFLSDPRLDYIPGPLRMLWMNDAANMARRAGEGGAESYKAIYEFGIAQTGKAHRAGVTVLMGTDAPDSFAFPGLGIHDEFAHFINAGLSPLDALRTATLAPAKFLGLEGKAGVIKVGARADIILLNANPLDDIQAVRGIDAVVLAAAHYDRKALDQMLKTVASNAGSWTMWPKFAWQIMRSPVMLKQFAD